MKRNFRLASGLSLVLGAAACNAIIGLEDVRLDEGAGASGGAQGASSSAGDAGSQAGGDVTGGGADAGIAGGDAGGSSNLAGDGTGGAADAGAGGNAGGSGAGGEAGSPVEPACPLPDQTVGGGELELVQLAPLDAGRGRLVVTKDGRHAYATTWPGPTQHFTRDPATGKLTPTSTANVFNGEYVALSPDDQHLYVCGDNALQYYDHALAADGKITDQASSLPPGFEVGIDALAFGDSAIFLASSTSIHAIVGGTYDASNRAPGSYDGVRTLTRGGDYLYWSEYSVTPWYPGHAPTVARTRVNCDGTLQPREAFVTSFSPYGVGVCPATGLLYVSHAAESLPDKPGFIEVIDLNACASNFSTCVPTTTITVDDVAGLDDPQGMSMAPDCSALYVSSGNPTIGRILVLSLENPLAPALLQTFAKGGTYDGVTLNSDVSAWHQTWFDGYLYAMLEFGSGVAVFKSSNR